MIGNFLARKNLLSDRFATVCMVCLLYTSDAADE